MPEIPTAEVNVENEPRRGNIAYGGSWERNGRSLNAAAILGLLGIGVLYFNAQTFLAVIGIVAKRLIDKVPEVSGTFLEKWAAAQDHYALPIFIAVLISQYLFMLVPSLYLVKRWHTGEVLKYVRLKGTSLAEVALAVLATLAIIPTGTYIAGLLTRWLDVPDVLLEINNKLFTAESRGEFLLLVFVIAITPAICEEIFFRGYVQRTFERSMKAKSVLLVGVLFGLFHMQPIGLITLSLLGILFGYFYYRSQSLLPGMAAHFANNFLAILVLYMNPKLGETDLAATAEIPFAWILATLPIGIALLFFYHKVTRRDEVASYGQSLL